MKCPKCDEEIADDNAIFCRTCGEKLKTNNTKYCPNCGKLTKSSASFCTDCGYNFTNRKSTSHITFRSPAFILGLIGSVIGFLISLLILTIGVSNLKSAGIIILTLSSIGFISTLYLKINKKIGGIVMIIVGLIFLLNASRFAFLEAIFIGLGGLIAVFKK